MANNNLALLQAGFEAGQDWAKTMRERNMAARLCRDDDDSSDDDDESAEDSSDDDEDDADTEKADEPEEEVSALPACHTHPPPLSYNQHTPPDQAPVTRSQYIAALAALALMTTDRDEQAEAAATATAAAAAATAAAATLVECQLCMNAPRTHCFLPCGHVGEPPSARPGPKSDSRADVCASCVQDIATPASITRAFCRQKSCPTCLPRSRRNAQFA